MLMWTKTKWQWVISQTFSPLLFLDQGPARRTYLLHLPFCEFDQQQWLCQAGLISEADPRSPRLEQSRCPGPRHSHSPDYLTPKSFKCRPDFERHCSSRKDAGVCLDWHSLGVSNVPLSARGGGEPLHQPRCHLEAAAAGKGTFMVPNGSANVEKQRPSYFLLSHASHLGCDRGCGLGPKGVRLAFQGAGWQLEELLLQQWCTAAAAAGSVW